MSLYKYGSCNIKPCNKQDVCCFLKFKFIWGTVFDQDALQIANAIMRPKGWDTPSVLSFLPSVPPAITGETPFWRLSILLWASQVALAVNSSPAKAGDTRDAGSIPGPGRSPGGGHGHPLQCSCLVNPVDRGAWRATVHRVAKSQTWLKWLSTHAHTLL